MSYGDRSPTAARLASRRDRAVQLAAGGMRPRQIAEELDVSRRTIQRDLAEALGELDESTRANAGTFRDHLLDDLEALADKMRAAVADAADARTLATLALAFVRVIERQAKLTGADEPGRHLIGVTGLDASEPVTVVDEINLLAKLPPDDIEALKAVSVALHDAAIDRRRWSDQCETARLAAKLPPGHYPADLPPAPEPPADLLAAYGEPQGAT